MLAHLSEAELESYLATGPFPPLTANTITDPAKLRLALDDIRLQGFAIDEQEIAEDLTCFAAPLRIGGEVVAAISLSFSGNAPDEKMRKRVTAYLLAASGKIECVLTE